MNDPSYSMKIVISSSTNFNLNYGKFLYENKHRLISFHFNDESIVEQFVSYSRMHLLFINIQSITLKQISAFQLLVVLFYLKSLSRLPSLKVHFNDHYHDLGEIYRIIFHLPALKYLFMATADPDSHMS